jgi:hypothetical protein
MRRPRKSFSWLAKMMTAIPLVKPVMTGCGMNFMMPPNFATPKITSMTPAIIVAIASPSYPCCWTMPYTITTNAPVGPPICTRDPPSAEMRKPATMAVQRPRSGATPLAIANAMANGNATIPTTTPAERSR